MQALLAHPRRRHLDYRELFRDVFLANIFIPGATFLAYSQSDVLDMRYFFLCGSMANVVMLLLHKDLPSKAPIFWTMLFASFNLFNLLKLVNERKQVAFTDEALDVFESSFAPHGFTPRQFSRLLKHITFRSVYEGEQLASEGAPVRSIVFLVQGSADLEVAGRQVAMLPPHSFSTSLAVLLPPTSATVDHGTKPASGPRAEAAATAAARAAAAQASQALAAATGRSNGTSEQADPLAAPAEEGAAAHRTKFVAAGSEGGGAEGSKAASIKGALARKAAPIAPTLRVVEGRPSPCTVRLSSASGRVMILPLAAVRRELDLDNTLRTPLLSLAAAETAQRLAWTHGGIGRLHRYRQRLAACLDASGSVNQARKAEAIAYAQRHGIEPEEHEAALHALGWSVEEFEKGFSLSAFRAHAARRMRDAGGAVAGAVTGVASLIFTPSAPEVPRGDGEDAAAGTSKRSPPKQSVEQGKV